MMVQKPRQIYGFAEAYFDLRFDRSVLYNMHNDTHTTDDKIIDDELVYLAFFKIP